MRHENDPNRNGPSRRDVVLTTALAGALGGMGLVASNLRAPLAGSADPLPTAQRIGGQDVTKALQHALDRIPEGGSGQIVIEPGVHRLTRPMTATGKTISVVLLGTLKDEVRRWNPDFLSKRLDDKGLLAFRRCKVTIAGVGGGYHVDGSAGEKGLAGLGRTLLFFDRCSVDLQGVKTKDSSGATIQGFGCSQVLYRDCSHDNAGQYGVFFLGGKNYTIERIRMRGSFHGALSVNRTGWGLALGRPQHVTITDCDIRGYSAKNDYAGGIVVNEGDHVRATGNISDGGGRASFAYSFAGCTDVYSRNTALNMSNNTVGTYVYAGVAFELDGVQDGDFDDKMVNCLGGYLLANNKNITLAGTYICDAGRSRRLDSGAGKTGMFMIANTASTSTSIVIDGASCDGGNSFITGAMAVSGLTIRNVDVRDTFYSVFNFEGGKVSGLTISGLSYQTPGVPPSAVIEAGDGVLQGITVSDATAVAGKSSNTSTFFSVNGQGLTLRFDRLQLTNLAIGVNDRYGMARYIALTDSQFHNVKHPILPIGRSTRALVTGNLVDGSAMSALRPWG